MKKIIFVRHGRAEEKVSEINDFERSLTLNGKVVSKIMASEFKKTGDDPGLIITSPAFRALETALIFALELKIRPEEIRIESDLYENVNLNVLLEMLAALKEDINTVTLVGHNPAFTEMADRLAEEGCEFMTKTSIVCLSFRSASWTGIRPSSGRIEYFLKPGR